MKWNKFLATLAMLIVSNVAFAEREQSFFIELFGASTSLGIHYDSRFSDNTRWGGRIGIASQALGIAAGALDEAINYAKERKQFGRSLAQFQNTQFQIANLDVKVEAARLLVYKAAWRESNNLPYSLDAARAKLFAAETAMEVTTKAVQIFGGYGYTREYPVERMMRDAKITEIYEGTSEVQRMVIAANIIK